MKEKVIKLGIERGYLPKSQGDDIVHKFDTQYLRLVEELGEASRELRLGNLKEFEMEVGDVLVLQTNCNYILDKYMEGRKLHIATEIERVVLMGICKFNVEDRLHFRDKCLQLAYDKILARGGMLINGDWFKPSDREYQEAKLKELEVEYKSLVDNPKVDGYVGKLKKLYSNLKNLNDSNLSDESISEIVFLETSVHGMLKEV